MLVHHTYDFPKPPELRELLARALGQGVLFSEVCFVPSAELLIDSRRKGEEHRQQKKILTPAFAPSALKELTPLIFEKSYKVICPVLMCL